MPAGNYLELSIVPLSEYPERYYGYQKQIGGFIWPNGNLYFILLQKEYK